MPCREVRRRLEAAGFRETSRKGSHVKFSKATAQGTQTVIVPEHRAVASATPRSLLRQAGLTWDEFDVL